MDVTLAHADAAERLGQYDGFVVGGATHMHHWLNEAASFVRHHQMLLGLTVPSGCTAASRSDRRRPAVRQGREAPGEGSVPREFGEFAETIRPRDARVFPGACDPDSPGPPALSHGCGRGLATPSSSGGYAKVQAAGGDCAAIKAWADGIARALGAGHCCWSRRSTLRARLMSLTTRTP